MHEFSRDIHLHDRPAYDDMTIEEKYYKNVCVWIIKYHKVGKILEGGYYSRVDTN